ncbi:BZ3500_MvSof-1268-A1-R1_Chr2-1g04697 [Microbotryum saponariae]|uniref:protein-tyrosine-phosphatase n=1 Tax=Microbotryum saponariae TaxID=289078 RepID=A0A2X0KMA0_9BASI|nr:BZ3500_MvSof-1268-A1-R1_Chr2-1g04697 [Microbotryum saponariae]SCZ92346.1 BZ3501_MvSof-1269-A2-R1_Chr2-1g04353 [Microbotryum saponariae]
MADAHMHQVMSNLWIGDYIASQDANLLEKHKIKLVVAAMRQTYEPLPGTTLHRVPIDDTASANIIEHFVPVSRAIASARLKSHAVLVHCQAGVSRSSALVAAYLMKEMDLTVEQALARVRKARLQIEPSDFFMLQLELFERCDCEWNPVKYAEERRFLMSFAQNEIMGGVSPSIVLAYYPSPTPSPIPSPKGSAPGTPLTMTPMPTTADPSASDAYKFVGASPPVESSTSTSLSDRLGATTTPTPAPVPRKRLTPRKAERETERQSAEMRKIPSIEKIGNKQEVVISGRRIRCKMCRFVPSAFLISFVIHGQVLIRMGLSLAWSIRRELAAREHVLAHEPGKGQQAFAPHRRDMAAHRMEMEARRRDEMDKEERERAIPNVETDTSIRTSVDKTEKSPATALAGLRISRPLPGLGVRAVVQRPTVSRPRPPSAPESTVNESTTSSTSIPGSGEAPESSHSASASDAAKESEAEVKAREIFDPPILPSHLCSSYFTEPLSWMSPILESGALGGKIVCPNAKCGAKLGSFDWAGARKLSRHS